MTETNTELATADTSVVPSEAPSTPALTSSSSSSPPSSSAADDETKRRRILSKMWGKGNKSSQKVRELEKSSMPTSNDPPVEENSDHLTSLASSTDLKASAEDSANSINSSKPLAVVKPIVVVKSERTRVNSEASSTTLSQIDQSASATVAERQSTVSTTTTVTAEQQKSKKKKSQKNDESKKKKSTREKSAERGRSDHRQDEETNRQKNTSAKDRHRSPRHQSSSTSVTRRRSRSRESDSSRRRSRQSTTTRKEESSSSSKRSPSSPKNGHSKSKRETSTSRRSSPRHHHHHRRRSSSTPLSRSPSRSRPSTTTTERLSSKTTASPKKEDRCSTTADKSSRPATESTPNSKPTNSISSSEKHRQADRHSTDTNDSQRDKPRTNDENQTERVNGPETSSSSSSIKQETPKTSTSSSRYDRRPAEPSSSNDSALVKAKSTAEKESTSNNDNGNHRDKKSSPGSSIPSSHDHRRRRSPSRSDRRSDHHHRHRAPHYSKTHYVHHHHHHHYRSSSSRYHRYHHRRSSSPHSRQRHLRHFSSTSSSMSPSPRRRSRSRTSSSSSTRSSSSYSSVSRSSSSRSSSRNRHYYHRPRHLDKFRRSPTLEKLFLKASESIESVSTQKNPNVPTSASSSASHFLPLPPPTPATELPITPLSETAGFYSEAFTGFSAPPPPFSLPPQQRCLKEITTNSSALRRAALNGVQTMLPSTLNEDPSSKGLQPSDSAVTARRPPRVSRFSDITPTTPTEPVLNANIPVDTPLNYAQISDNINCLPASRRQQKRHNREVMECECSTSEYDRSRGIKACGSDCLNRMLLIECGPMCPCGQWCSNRRFQRRSYASHKLALFKTEMKGYGLRTVSSIRKGRFLVEYVGEVVDMDELARRNKKYKREGNTHQYVMSLIHGTVIDSTMKGNWARYINHSCEPNCVAEKWLVNGEYRMGIFAKRDIDGNEEITIDYRFETTGAVDLASEKCYCGAPTCRGTISIRTNNNNNNNNSSNGANKRQNRRQPLDDDELLDYLRDEETNEYTTPKTIDEIRQLIQIMSRTDSESVRTIELDLIKSSSQKHVELPRLFLECNGLHVLCSWMKDILIEDEQDQPQYSDEFKYQLLDFIHTVLPIKDRTVVIKNGLFELVSNKLKLPPPPTAAADLSETSAHESIATLMTAMLDHLDNPIVTKLFHIYTRWATLKERFIIPKRKEPESSSDHQHHHHHRHQHHHSSRHHYDESSPRLTFSTRSSGSYPKPFDRPYSRRSHVPRDTPRTFEEQLSKDERRKLFEQQYEDEERARAAAAAAANGESPGSQNEPPHKKQRTSDNADPILSGTPSQPDVASMPATYPWALPPNAVYPHGMDQAYWFHQHLSQIPIEYIRSYMTSIDQPSASVNPIADLPLPPPARPEDEAELARIVRLPAGWSVATCPTDSSVYYYNRQTMTTSWTLPTETPAVPLDLSPLSSAQITEQRRPHHHHHHHHSHSPSSHPHMRPSSRHLHRHTRSHRHHHMSSSSSGSHKRKRPSASESTGGVKEELSLPSIDEPANSTAKEPMDDEQPEAMSVTDAKVSMEEKNELEAASEAPDTIEESTSSARVNRDHLRKNISQHVHTTLKPYTKRTCKQGRIVSTDDIKYLVKKFTLAVLDKEIEKAKNDGAALSSVLTDRVRLKTELYVKKYMNKMGAVFQRHEGPVAPSAPLDSTASQAPAAVQATTSNSE